MSGRKAPKSENSFHGMASALKRRYSHSLALNFSYKTAISEVVGVAGFVLVGCGVAALVTAPDTYSGGQYVSRMLNSSIVGLAFGFGIFFMISATAHNNSDQLNPAITLALIASGSTPLLQGSINICAQVLGAIIGAGFLRALLPGSFAGESTLGANSVPVDVSRGQAFLAEFLGTLIATFVVLEIACNPRSTVGDNGPLVVGATFGALLIVLSPISSGSLNPARTLGPAAIAHISADLWIWIFGPIIGALCAVPIHLMLVHAPSSDLHAEALAQRKPSFTDGHEDSPAEPHDNKAGNEARAPGHAAGAAQRSGSASYEQPMGTPRETFYPAQSPRNVQ